MDYSGSGSASRLAGWQAAIPALVTAIGGDGLPAQLDVALCGLVAFDLSCIFAYPGPDRPLLLHDGLHGVSAPQILENYLNGTYLLDAVYTACIQQTPTGLYRLRELAPDAFFQGEYYNSPEVHPCVSMESGALAEEIVFLAPLAGNLYLAYSLLRQQSRPAFSNEEMDLLRTTMPMVTALITKHWKHLADLGSTAEAAAPDEEQAIEQAFQLFAATVLTRREQAIVSLILRGHSSLSIGHLLNIAEGTVKIHRKHIYAKLGISSQTELFNRFIEHLLARRPPARMKIAR